MKSIEELREIARTSGRLVMAERIQLVQYYIQSEDAIFQQYCNKNGLDEWMFSQKIYAFGKMNDDIVNYLDGVLSEDLAKNDVPWENVELNKPVFQEKLSLFLEKITDEAIDAIYYEYFVQKPHQLNIASGAHCKISNEYCESLHASGNKSLKIAALLAAQRQVESLLAGNIQFGAMESMRAPMISTTSPANTLFQQPANTAGQSSEINPCCCVIF